MKIFRILKELNNYFFIRRTIRKNKDSAEWKKNNLREAYFGVMYTVINLPEEVFESEPQYHQVYVIEQLKPINEYMTTLNLQEVITLSMENKCNKERGEYAFVIKYVPLFKDFTLFYLIKWTVIISVSWWAIDKFDLIQKFKVVLLWIQNFIK